MTRGSGQLVVAVLSEALKKFGRIGPHNTEQVARWVRRRVRELTGDQAEVTPFQPKGFDAKARAAGDDQ
jgi:hypothetical protein